MFEKSGFRNFDFGLEICDIWIRMLKRNLSNERRKPLNSDWIPFIYSSLITFKPRCIQNEWVEPV